MPRLNRSPFRTPPPPGEPAPMLPALANQDNTMKSEVTDADSPIKSEIPDTDSHMESKTPNLDSSIEKKIPNTDSPMKNETPNTDSLMENETPDLTYVPDTTGYSTGDSSGQWGDTPVRPMRGKPYQSKALFPKKIVKTKKRRTSKRAPHFSSYIYKVLRQVHPDLGMSTKAMGVMNNFVVDIFDRISKETAELVLHSKKSTVTCNDVKMACCLLLPGELAQHACAEGLKAVSAYAATPDSPNGK